MNALISIMIVLSFVGIAACGTAPKHASSALADSASTSQGPQGPKGDAGPAGPQGAPGKNGGVGCYLESNDEYLGQAVGNGCLEIYFSDKVSTSFDGNGNPGLGCIFTTTDCTGTCYAGAMAKNTAWYDGSKWWEITGKEKTVPVQPQSYWNAVTTTPSCHTIASSGNLIALTKEWTPPVTLTIPLGIVYIGDEQ